MLLPLILAFISFPCIQTDNLIEVRNQYEKCENSETQTNQLHANLEKTSNPSNTLKAYLGATKTIMAKFAWSPYQKLAYFNEGKGILEKTIQNEPGNIEIRYLRLTIQLSAPSILSYNAAIESDKKYILNRLKSLSDEDLKNRITRFLLVRGNLSNEERKMLQ